MRRICHYIQQWGLRWISKTILIDLNSYHMDEVDRLHHVARIDYMF